MSGELDYDVIVVGAGIVGASTALWVQQDGKRVLLLDSRAPGSATSYGNAGVIAAYACVPINSPDVLKRLPGLLFGKDSPLSIDWRYALTHLSWQLAFLRNCSATRVENISVHLAQLLTLVDAGIDPLLALSGADKCLAGGDGCFYVFDTRAGYDAARDDTEKRRRYGAVVTELNADEFRELEPGLRMQIYRAILFEGARWVRNPQQLVECYVERLTKDGGCFMPARVSSVTAAGDSVSVETREGTTLTCNKLVIAAGPWSRGIRGSGAEDLPLDTERGYHIEFKRHGALVQRPVCWVDRGFYATPMEQGLRVAGTVELAGLADKQNAARIDYLTRYAHTMFGDIGRPDDTWLGFRPTFPDALPVIGPSPRSQNILFAFGHQHIGMTLGGATGMLIADLIVGREPRIDLHPYRATRFTRDG